MRRVVVKRAQISYTSSSPVGLIARFSWEDSKIGRRSIALGLSTKVGCAKTLLLAACLCIEGLHMVLPCSCLPSFWVPSLT